MCTPANNIHRDNWESLTSRVGHRQSHGKEKVRGSYLGLPRAGCVPVCVLVLDQAEASLDLAQKV